MNNSFNSINDSSTQQTDRVGNSQCSSTLWAHLWFPMILAFLSFVFFCSFQFVVRWYLFGKWTFPTFSYFKRRRRRRPTEKNASSSDGSSGSSSGPKRSMDSKSLEIVPPNKKWRISNEFVSLFHSILSGGWSLAILSHFEFYIDDLINTESKEARYLTYMSFGYLVHDFIDLVINERSARIIELLFHHVVVLMAFIVTQWSCKFVYIISLGLLMEVNSIFLHSRSLCNLYRQPKESNLFKIIALVNIATFMLFRIAVSLILIGWLFNEYIQWEMEWYLLLVNTVVICSLSVTNTVLCYRVLAADGLLGARRARRHQPQDEQRQYHHHQPLQAGQQKPSPPSSDNDESSSEDEGAIKLKREVEESTKLKKEEAEEHEPASAAEKQEENEDKLKLNRVVVVQNGTIVE